MRQLVATLLILPLLGACALLEPKKPAGPSPLELQVQAMEQRIARLERQVQGVANSDIIGRIESASDRERSMRGKVEEMQFKLQQALKRQQSLYRDLDQRVEQVEKGGSSAAPVSVSSGSNNDTIAFNAAKGLLREKAYGDAASALQSFINGYPESQHVGSAYYWLGQSQYVTGNYAAAAASFQSVVNNYPDDKNARDAGLYSAFVDVKQGRKATAKQKLRNLIAEHPGTTAAKLAQEKLKEIGG